MTSGFVAAWPTPFLAGQGRLGRNERASGTIRVDHMSTHDFRMAPKKALDRKKWKLRVRIDGPGRAGSPVAAVVRQKPSGSVERTLVSLNRKGNGQLVVPFNRKQTGRVYVVVGNASTRFDCRGPYTVGYSCGGTAKDDNLRFEVSFRTFAGSS